MGVWRVAGRAFFPPRRGSLVGFISGMRAFYATHKTVRVFVLGTPDGWHVALYDLTRKEWRHVEEKPHPTLQEAKTCALARAELLVGRLPPKMKWL